MSTPNLESFLADHQLPKSYGQLAERYFLPVAEQIKNHQSSAAKTIFVGINGAQGSGKSTLVSLLDFWLTQQHQLSVVAISLDDFYLSPSERQTLADDIHPLFKTRGVPGTHNTDLINQVLLQLSAEGSVELPSFDKATDTPKAKDLWKIVKTPVDVVLFEGWSWGICAQETDSLTQPINQLEEVEDEAATWRKSYMNFLKKSYEPLYQKMDYWLMLQAPSFDCIYNWRLEQEQKLKNRIKPRDDTAIMNEQQIARFIQHYQRLTEHGLATLPERCDWVIKLDENRQVIELNKNPTG